MESNEQFSSRFAIDAKATFDASALKGKSVVITGGASGLGEEFAKQFVRAGAFVTIGDINEKGAKKLVTALGEDKAAYSHCDVQSFASQVTLFKTAVARSPTHSIEIVCANAGISGEDQVWQTDDSAGPEAEPEEPDLRILQTNIIGVAYTAKLAAHYLSRRKHDAGAPSTPGSLILTASLAGYLDMPGGAQYAASKWAVRGLMRSLRRTMPKQGLRVNLVAPWFIRTPIMSDTVQQRITDSGISFAAKEDAARAVLHLAADASANGRAIAILPREVSQDGYIDLQTDDFSWESAFTEWQAKVAGVTYRTSSQW